MRDTSSGQPVPDISHLTLSGYLDQLPHETVVCAPDGMIVHVNRAWLTFSARNGYNGPPFPGLNYFDICHRSDGVERTDGQRVVEGLRGVISKSAGVFQHTYPCHAPSESAGSKLWRCVPSNARTPRSMSATIVLSDTVMGAGIGLATVKDVVDAMGGEISVRSELNVGTVFTVVFPSWRSAPPA